MGKRIVSKKGKKSTKKPTGQGKVLDLGVVSASSKLIRKAKTHKGRKYLEKMGP